MDRDEPVLSAREVKGPGFPPPTVDIREQALSVTYCSTFENTWPIWRHLVTRRPLMWVLYVLNGFSADVLIALSLARFNPWAALFSLPFGWMAGVAGCYGFMLFGSWMAIRFQTRGGERICTTSLVQTGVTDLMPEKRSFLAWKQIHSIRVVEGGVVFLTFTGGCLIPESAFSSELSRHDFFVRASRLWKSNGADWHDVATSPTNDR